MGQEGNAFDEYIRKQAQELLPEPYFVNTGDVSRWSNVVGPDLNLLDGYNFTTILSGSQKGKPTYYAVRNEYGSDAISYPKMPKKKKGDFHYATEDELLTWRNSIAQELGISENDLHFGPRYVEQTTYVSGPEMEEIPAKIPVLDHESLALYTIKNPHQVP